MTGTARTRWGEMPKVLRQQLQQTAIVGMALLGVGVSVYLTIEHYAKVEAFCPVGGLVNCAQVLTSRYSMVPGTQMPVTLPGLLWFLVSGALAAAVLIAAFRGDAEPGWLRPTLLAWSSAGLLFVLYLVYAEIVLIHSLCLWCTVVHLLTLLTFLVALAAWQKGPLVPQPVQPARPRQVGRQMPPARATIASKGQSMHSARHAPVRLPRSRRR